MSILPSNDKIGEYEVRLLFPMYLKFNNGKKKYVLRDLFSETGLMNKSEEFIQAFINIIKTRQMFSMNSSNEDLNENSVVNVSFKQSKEKKIIRISDAVIETIYNIKNLSRSKKTQLRNILKKQDPVKKIKSLVDFLKTNKKLKLMGLKDYETLALFKLELSSITSTVTLSYDHGRTQRTSDFRCWGYNVEIIVDKNHLSIPKAQWGLYFPENVFVAPHNSNICPPNNDTSEYHRGENGKPQVIITKKKGGKKFPIHFTSFTDRPVETKIVLCRNLKNSGWKRIRYISQYTIMGPKKTK